VDHHYIEINSAGRSYRLDLQAKELYRERQARVRLTRKQWDLLKFLVEQEPRKLVTKNELLENVWPKVHVGDETIAKTVGALRVALQDNRSNPAFIETVHGDGYRFIGDVTRLGADRSSVPADSRAGRTRFGDYGLLPREEGPSATSPHVSRPDAAVTVPALIHALKDPEEEIRSRAAVMLARVGPDAADAVPALAEALRDPNKQVRWRAADALGRIGPRAVPALIVALDDPKKEIRWRAANMLSRIGPAASEAVPALIGALNDPESKVRWHVADALGRIGPCAGQAVPALAEAIKDSANKVRSVAAEALVRIRMA
jgi:DNA-binding winged helix-turn-helix (wHTH) protein